MCQISIVIPAYNSEKTIGETIASVQQQSFTDYEIIVIDDGSKDRTLEVVKNIKEPRLKLFAYENGGVATARNRGISHATGEFLSFLDADDLWTPDKLESHLEALKRNPKAKVAYSWTNFIDTAGKFLFSGPRFRFQGAVYPQLLQINFLVNASNLMIHRDVLEVVKGYNTKLSHTADWDFYLRLAENFDFVVVPKFQNLYRQSANSMSSNIEPLKKEGLALLDRIYQTASSELKQQSSKSYSSLYLYYAGLYRNKAITGDRKCLAYARQNFKMSIISDPQSLLRKNSQRLLIKLILLHLSVQKRSRNSPR